MQQVVTFVWICGLYMALSYAMAYAVSAYDPRRPKQAEPKDDDEPKEKNGASRAERAVGDDAQWCLGLRDVNQNGPRPAVVVFGDQPWMKNAIQHASGNKIVVVDEAKYFSRYSKAILVVGQPKQEEAARWNSLYMGWILNFKGPMIGVRESTLASDPEGQLRRVLRFLGQNATGVECALKRLTPPQETTFDLKLEAKEKLDMVMSTLNASTIQVQ